MHIKSIRTLSGPNIYSHRPVLLMRLDLDHLDEKETREFKGFNDRLVACLPGLNDHQCEVVREHLLHGGTAYLIEDGWLVERTRSETHKIIDVFSVPATMDGIADFQVANLLAAIAACRSQNVPRQVL